MSPLSDPSPLANAAQRARSIIDRVAGTGDGSDWLSQVESGAFDSELSAEDADAVRERLVVVAEHLRHARAVTGSQTAGPDIGQDEAGSGFAALGHTRLPINRKERYYTGTVLPGLIAGDGLLHLSRFLRLCGVEVPSADIGNSALDGAQDVQVFTEYSFAESLMAADHHRFPDAPLDADTPDLVLAGPDWLLAIEAKMFHRPTQAALHNQMTRQAVLVDYWARTFQLDPRRVRHVLLLPGSLLRERPKTGQTWPVVTWEDVERCYAVAGDAYWLGVLRVALSRYPELASAEPTFGVNADGTMLGSKIAEGKAAKEGFGWVGRTGGLHGAAFTNDAATGTWEGRLYELRREAPPPSNGNWFSVHDFVAAVT